MKGGVQGPGEERSLAWNGQGGLPWRGAVQADPNDGRTISVTSQANGTASARDSEANKGSVWPGDKTNACVAQMENK